MSSLWAGKKMKLQQPSLSAGTVFLFLLGRGHCINIVSFASVITADSADLSEL